jgi:hypothetical protein
MAEKICEHVLDDGGRAARRRTTSGVHVGTVDLVEQARGPGDQRRGNEDEVLRVKIRSPSATRSGAETRRARDPGGRGDYQEHVGVLGIGGGGRGRPELSLEDGDQRRESASLAKI